MTKPKNRLDEERKRPRRGIGKWLRGVLRCPRNGCEGELRVVGPYREYGKDYTGQDHALTARLGITARLECQECGLRFSVRVADVARARQRELVLEASSTGRHLNRRRR